MFSYHGGHSGEFCRHAEGTLEQVVRRAVELGFTHYGLTEHAPRFREQDLAPSEEDLGVQGLSDMFGRYILKAVELRDAWEDQIEILIGFETERVPPDRWLALMQELREKGPFDYIVGSVHDVGGRWIDSSAEETRRLENDLGGPHALHAAYFDAVADMVSSLRPEVVAHLDLVRKFEGSEFQFSQSVDVHIVRALEAVQSYGGILDVNCAAFRRGLGPVYPLPQILAQARRMGIPATLGDDSHGPDTVGVGLNACVEAISEAGYAEIQMLTRQNGWVPVSLNDLSSFFAVP